MDCPHGAYSPLRPWFLLSIPRSLSSNAIKGERSQRVRFRNPVSQKGGNFYQIFKLLPCRIKTINIFFLCFLLATVPCPDGFFKCKDSGQCLSKSLKCDFFEDCPDGSDENDCWETGKWSAFVSYKWSKKGTSYLFYIFMMRPLNFRLNLYTKTLSSNRLWNQPLPVIFSKINIFYLLSNNCNKYL